MKTDELEKRIVQLESELQILKFTVANLLKNQQVPVMSPNHGQPFTVPTTTPYSPPNFPTRPLTPDPFPWPTQPWNPWTVTCSSENTK